MSPMQQILLGSGGAVATKTYVDDVFSTFLYTGTGSAKTINNGIDLSGEGGMVWSKARNETYAHLLQDTVRGTSEVLFSNSNNAEATRSDLITSFNNNGYTAGVDAFYGSLNHGAGSIHSGWTFRKAPGFFDVVTYTGNGAGGGRNINHSLSSIPGCVIVKCTSESQDWAVYHRGVGTSGKYLSLNDTDAATTDFNVWNNNPTSTYFSIGSSDKVNKNNATYIAYIFAGGEEGYNSVDFDGTGDYLSFPSSGHVAYGTGDFTVEAWLKPTSGASGVFLDHGVDDPMIGILSGKWQYYNSTVGWKYAGNATAGVWTHFAVARESGTTRMFINGALITSFSDSHDYGSNATSIGAYNTGSFRWTGSISNARIVSGTAVYTSAFTPSTTPLTNIANTVLLCCNGDLPTSSTVNQLGTMTANGDPHTTGTSPFTSPAAAVFGENEDQNVIKCGSFKGDGTSTGPDVYLGWEPQWVMIKSSSNADSWVMFDSMRGVVTGGGDQYLFANSTFGSTSTAEYIEFNSTGFTLKGGGGNFNNTNDYIFLAIRRSDGYVGKQYGAGEGTSVFAMDTGAGSSYIPNFDANFPVDFQFLRQPASTYNWYVGARLLGHKYLETNDTAAEGAANAAYWRFDDNKGWNAYNGYDSTYQSWMWKRHAGFDVVAYDGQNSAFDLYHNLGKTPEMIFFKSRSNATGWVVYHKGLNGGTNAEQYYLQLDTTAAEAAWGGAGQILSLSSTKVGLNSWSGLVSQYGRTYISMLFASTDVSKVGSYTGDGTNNGSHEITCGFTPRFLIIKCVTSGVNFSHWRVWDSLNGLDGSGGEDYLKLNSDGAKVEAYDYIDTTSTGFKFNTNFGPVNGNGNKMIYYAHA